MENKVKEVNKALLDLLDPQVIQVLRVTLEHLALLVNQEQMVTLVKEDLQDHRGFKDSLGLLEYLVLWE